MRDNIEDMLETPKPIDTGALRRKAITGSIGCPIWLYDLIQKSDIHTVTAIELGKDGRGVKTAEKGWVSISELREMADQLDQ